MHTCKTAKYFLNSEKMIDLYTTCDLYYMHLHWEVFEFDKKSYTQLDPDNHDSQMIDPKSCTACFL